MSRHHHFLPRFYLARFAGADGRIVAYRRGSHRPPARPSPKRFAYEPGMYEIDPAEVSTPVDPEFVEESLAVWERDAAAALERVDAAGAIDRREDLRHLMWFACLLAERTPSAREDHDRTADGVAKGHLLSMLLDPEGRRRAPDLVRSLGLPEDPGAVVTPEDVLQRLDRFRVRLSRTEWALDIVQFALDRLEWYCKLFWAIGHAPTGSSFVTSDSPVAHGHLPGVPIFGPVNIAEPCAEISFPVSPGKVLLGAWRPRPRAFRLERAHVEDINHRTIWRCARWVISHRTRPKTALVVRSLGRSERLEVALAVVPPSSGTTRPGVIVRTTAGAAPRALAPPRSKKLNLLGDRRSPMSLPPGLSPFGGLVEQSRQLRGVRPIPPGLRWRELPPPGEDEEPRAEPRRS